MLDHTQIGANRKCVVVAEFELGHVGVAARNSPFERAWKFIKIDAAAERPESWRIGMPAFAFNADGMTTSAELRNQRLATGDWILRLG